MVSPYTTLLLGWVAIGGGCVHSSLLHRLQHAALLPVLFIMEPARRLWSRGIYHLTGNSILHLGLI